MSQPEKEPDNITTNTNTESNMPALTQSDNDKKIMKYRNLALAFINQHKSDLVKIFLQHSRDAIDADKIGVLGINLFSFDETGKIDVAYLPVHMLEPPITERITERIKENDIHIIYFLLITPMEEQILEIDIRGLM